jgi:hypothetical protein
LHAFGRRCSTLSRIDGLATVWLRIALKSPYDVKAMWQL